MIIFNLSNIIFASTSNWRNGKTSYLPREYLVYVHHYH